MLSNEMAQRILVYENSKSIASLVEEGSRLSAELLWDRTFVEGALLEVCQSPTTVKKP